MKALLHAHFPTGHVLPMLAVAKELVNQGHEVVFLTHPSQRARVEAADTRISFAPTRLIAKLDEILMEESCTGLLEDDPKVLKRRLLFQFVDYARVLTTFEADIILVDVMPLAAQALYESIGLKYATLGVIPFYTSGPSAPLHRSGRGPLRSWLGRMINRLRHFYRQYIVLPLRIRPVINAQRAILGLPGVRYGMPAETFLYSPILHLQASSPLLEFGDLPPATPFTRHYLGPLTGSNSDSGDRPSWWKEASSKRHVIAVTQGTLAMDPTSLIMPSIEALANDGDTALIVVSPHVDEITAKFEGQELENVYYAKWLPYDMLLQSLTLLITNGGYGSITQALSKGVPLICAGQTEDKKDTAARVAWTGAGIDLKTDSPSKELVKTAVDEIRGDRRYHKQAAVVQEELQALGGAAKAVSLLEMVVESPDLACI